MAGLSDFSMHGRDLDGDTTRSMDLVVTRSTRKGRALDYAVGLLVGWTYLDFYGGDSTPRETGQWFFTKVGALKGWRRNHDVDTGYWACVVLRNDQVSAWIEGWANGHVAVDTSDTVPTFPMEDEPC